jgi:hypothetical protein
MQSMPVTTDIERRNCALIAFTILTGARDGAIASSLAQLLVPLMMPMLAVGNRDGGTWSSVRIYAVLVLPGSSFQNSNFAHGRAARRHKLFREHKQIFKLGWLELRIRCLQDLQVCPRSARQLCRILTP